MEQAIKLFNLRNYMTRYLKIKAKKLKSLSNKWVNKEAAISNFPRCMPTHPCRVRYTLRNNFKLSKTVNGRLWSGLNHIQTLRILIQDTIKLISESMECTYVVFYSQHCFMQEHEGRSEIMFR